MAKDSYKKPHKKLDQLPEKVGKATRRERLKRNIARKKK